MEEDEDDLYATANADGQQQEMKPEAGDLKEEPMDEGEEEEDEEDDDDDVNFNLEMKEGAKTELTRPTVKATPSHDQKPTPEVKHTSTPSIKPDRSKQTPAPPTTSTPRDILLSSSGKEGKDYPAPHTSKLDLDSVPSWPSTNKPITHLDIDADLADHSKPWRLPGTDQTDFFNYGFDEYTWTQYCLKQQSMQQGIQEQRNADAQMKAMFGGGGPGAGGPGGGMPGMGGGAGPGGMPPEMEQMMQQMMAQGMNPGSMQDFNSFMGMMGGGGGPSQGMQQGMGGPQGGGFQGPGRFGGRQSQSPAPGGGGGQQGFQPPQGPAGGMNMEGFSQQQLEIMQNGGMGGGRGRGRRGRW